MLVLLTVGNLEGCSAWMTLWIGLSVSFLGHKMVIILFIVYFLGFQALAPPPPQKKNSRNKGEKLLQNLKCAETSAGIGTCKKTTLLQNSDGKERQEHYPTSAAYMCSRYRVVFLFFFSANVPYGSLLACFYPCLVSVLFTGPSLLEIKFCSNFFL